MMELFLIKTIAGQVSLFLACLISIMFLHRFFPFHHIIKKSLKLYLFISIASFVLRLAGNLEKMYWTAKFMQLFM